MERAKVGVRVGRQVNLPYLKPFSGSLLLVRQEDDMAHKVSPSVSSGFRPSRALCSTHTGPPAALYYLCRPGGTKVSAHGSLLREAYPCPESSHAT